MGTCVRVPPIVAANTKAQNLYDRSFAVKGPQLWNIIDKQIKGIESLELFKMKLDSFLGCFPDEPPIAGYVSQNYNSILEWRSAGWL